VGARGGREIAFDLAAVCGLGIDGVGAAAALRALIVNALGLNLLTGTPGAPAALQVMITAEDLADLLGAQPIPDRVPQCLRIVDTLGELLDLAEATVAARTSTPDGTDQDGGDPVGGAVLVVV